MQRIQHVPFWKRKTTQLQSMVFAGMATIVWREECPFETSFVGTRVLP
jgi:hypothetical protein